MKETTNTAVIYPYCEFDLEQEGNVIIDGMVNLKNVIIVHDPVNKEATKTYTFESIGSTRTDAICYMLSKIKDAPEIFGYDYNNYTPIFNYIVKHYLAYLVAEQISNTQGVFKFYFRLLRDGVIDGVFVARSRFLTYTMVNVFIKDHPNKPKNEDTIDYVDRIFPRSCVNYSAMDLVNSTSITHDEGGAIYDRLRALVDVTMGAYIAKRINEPSSVFDIYFKVGIDPHAKWGTDDPTDSDLMRLVDTKMPIVITGHLSAKMDINITDLLEYGNGFNFIISDKLKELPFPNGWR